MYPGLLIRLRSYLDRGSCLVMKLETSALLTWFLPHSGFLPLGLSWVTFKAASYHRVQELQSMLSIACPAAARRPPAFYFTERQSFHLWSVLVYIPSGSALGAWLGLSFLVLLLRDARKFSAL